MVHDQLITCVCVVDHGDDDDDHVIKKVARYRTITWKV